MEQEFLERCFQEMLDEEDQDWFIPARDLPPGMGQIQQQFNGLSVSDSNSNTEDIVVSFKTWQARFCLNAIHHANFSVSSAGCLTAQMLSFTCLT